MEDFIFIQFYEGFVAVFKFTHHYPAIYGFTHIYYFSEDVSTFFTFKEQFFGFFTLSFNYLQGIGATYSTVHIFNFLYFSNDICFQ